jgi:uncharacterized protein (DUF488 family)
MITLFTIGFCGKKEAEFYDLLNNAGVKLLIDIRLWRGSRFVPWASGENIKSILKDRYIHVPEFAPTKELLIDYKGNKITWNEYEKMFNEVINHRMIDKQFPRDLLDGACLLCSEKNYEKCHRRLVAEYLSNNFANSKIKHL